MVDEQLLRHFQNTVLGLLTCNKIKVNQLLILVSSWSMNFIMIHNLLRCILRQSSGTHQVCRLLWQVPGTTNAVLVLQQMHHQQLGYRAPRPCRQDEEGLFGLIHFSLMVTFLRSRIPYTSTSKHIG